MSQKRVAAIVVIVALAGAAVAQAIAFAETARARDEIETLVERAYVHGAFNEQNTKAMREGFHPGFAIHGVADGELSRYPIDEWIAAIDERKTKPDYRRETWTHRLPLIDVTGDAAIVKVELTHDGELVYTDYLSLLKLDGGWTITDKVYHRHPES